VDHHFPKLEKVRNQNGSWRMHYLIRYPIKPYYLAHPQAYFEAPLDAGGYSYGVRHLIDETVETELLL
jgi:hypothetical protein